MIGFQENVKNTFSSLRKYPEFADVTLACEDGNQVEVHKVVLAASSPYFYTLLTRNKHSHPMIYMRGLTFPDLVDLVDFFYYGEANIYHENLDNFLNIATELDLKGFYDKNGGLNKRKGEEKMHSKETDRKASDNINIEPKTQIDNTSLEDKYHSETVIFSKKEISGDLKDMDEKIKTMIGLSENMVQNGARKMARAYLCKVCGKESLLTNIKDHIKAIHLEGILRPCNFCGKLFRSRNGLRKHVLVHKEEQVFIFC